MRARGGRKGDKGSWLTLMAVEVAYDVDKDRRWRAANEARRRPAASLLGNRIAHLPLDAAVCYSSQWYGVPWATIKEPCIMGGKQLLM